MTILAAAASRRRSARCEPGEIVNAAAVIGLLLVADRLGVARQ